MIYLSVNLWKTHHWNYGIIWYGLHCWIYHIHPHTLWLFDSLPMDGPFIDVLWWFALPTSSLLNMVMFQFATWCNQRVYTYSNPNADRKVGNYEGYIICNILDTCFVLFFKSRLPWCWLPGFHDIPRRKHRDIIIYVCIYSTNLLGYRDSTGFI